MTAEYQYPYPPAGLEATYPFVEYQAPQFSETEMLARAQEFYAEVDQRRSVRMFSDAPVPRELIELAVKAASTAPSGAHKQPWTFVATQDPVVIAPWIVVLFEQRFEQRADGSKGKNYYVKESTGIAAGMFVTALHHMGLATLTHTPSPMAFLRQVLGRPENERPFVLFPVGYPLEGVKVPDIKRKSLGEVFVEVTAEDG